MRTPAIVLFLLAAALRGQTPVRVAVISHYPQAIREAVSAFEERYGKGLLDLRLLDYKLACDALEGARVVYVHGGFWSPQMAACTLTVADMHRNGVRFGVSMGSALQANWRISASPGLRDAATYLNYGGAGNLAAFLAMLYRAGGGERQLEIPKPEPQAERGIYHPKAPGVFPTLAAYLAWYRAAGLVPAGAPLVGIAFFGQNQVYRDTAHIEALIAALERRGLGAVPVFAWPLRQAEPLLIAEGRPVVRLLFCLNLLMPNPDNTRFLEQYGLHAINLITTRETYAQWKASRRGLPPERIPIQVGTAERSGASEPILLAATEDNLLAPVPERIEAAASRAARWVALGSKPNGSKRVAIIYFNNPPGKGTLGASYLNLLPSLSNVLAALQKAGYQVDGRIPNEEQLKRLLEPGKPEELLAAGHAALLPMEQYERWYAELPADFRTFTEKTWGPPARSTLMTVGSEGKSYFVIPGIELGNIFLGPQPMRADPRDAAGRQHDPDYAAPHSYIACYLWYRHRFGADALVHMGRHGTLEWLPGKDVAQSGSDAGEVLVGDLPHANYYVVDGGGEYLQVKRRAGGVLISHLTPMLVEAGTPPEHRRLRDAIENRERVLESNPALASQYEVEIRAEARRLKLDRQLGLALEGPGWIGKIEEFVHDVQSQPIPMGMHTIGAPVNADVLRDALTQFLVATLPAGKSARAAGWAADLLAGREPQDLASKTIAEARTWLAAVEQSPERELDALVALLDGRYLATGISGDPLRAPDALPTGRNMHDVDPRAFPTRAAWEVGKRMAQALIDDWRGRHGKPPEKISFVLWYGETNRHQGITEAQALYLLGVEPVWNGRAHVDDVKLIPAAQLGRPRVDVVLTMSGLYRDAMPDKVRLLDKAVRLAAAAPDENPVARNTRRVAEALERQGMAPDAARQMAAARLFGPAPGAFGVGMGRVDAANPEAAGNDYLRNMGYAYTEGVWGRKTEGHLREQLRDNQAVIHSRSTNLYGVLDNDDTYQFAGGLSAATTAAGGAEPALFISNVRRRGAERLEDMKAFLGRDMNARLWNPKWIEGMKSAGYAGAREMAREVEHLYGWRATAPGTVDASVWRQAYDVYVADKYNLKLAAFFGRQNPEARRLLAARLMEVDRQGLYSFSGTERRLLRLAAAQTGAAPGAAARARSGSRVLAGGGRRSRRTGTLEELFPGIRFFRVSESAIHIGGVEVGWGWLLVWLPASTLLGALMRAARNRTARTCDFSLTARPPDDAVRN